MTSESTPPGEPSYLWYRFWRFWWRYFFAFYHKLECYHPERVPETGPFLLVANHVSYLDPPLMGVCASRVIHYVGRKSLFRYWWSNLILRSVNVIPVDLDGASASAIKSVVRMLTTRNGVLLFPEGTRSDDGKLLKPKLGVGWIVHKTGVPVVPARIWGTEVAMPKHGRGRRAQIEVKFGKPLWFDRNRLPKDRREASEQIARIIMEAIASLQPNED